MNQCDQKVECFGLFGAKGEALRNQSNQILIDENFGGCIICGNRVSKYKCPACEAKTCSLNCCKDHKIEFSCDGVRNRISFKRMVDYDQSQFLDDYFFLEDAERTIDSLRRDKRQIVKSLDTLPPWLKKLIYEAKMRRIRLKLLPAGFKRRLNNKTTYMYAEKMIFWDLEWVLTHCVGVNSETITVINRRVPENTMVSKVIENIVKPNSDEEWNKKYSMYQSAGFKGICVLLELQCKKYCEVDLSSTISEVLSGKTIIEYPTFLITLKDNKHSFDVIDEDSVVTVENEIRENAYKKLKTFEQNSCTEDQSRPYGPLPVDYYDNFNSRK
ncbi:box C/D snoRNA protein 1-like protein [Leptotrombidium deliense]|uniref:Box C/D snoRNA protein 1-like protein n=1 Tax=Leptotrombidium deliense TaxID=299467 RepID=A0A443SPH0_9ACAR|nr:box C/D snoRNA protein 1-like protein [Leptotrombidium deliense]